MNISPNVNYSVYNKSNCFNKLANKTSQTSPNFKSKVINAETLKPVLDKTIVPVAAPLLAGMALPVILHKADSSLDKTENKEKVVQNTKATEECVEDEEDEDIDFGDIPDQISREDFFEKAKEIKNNEVRKYVCDCFDNDEAGIYDYNLIELGKMIEEKIGFVKDDYVMQHLKAIMNNCTGYDMYTIIQVLDAYNTLEGNYTQTVSPKDSNGDMFEGNLETVEYIKNLKKTSPDLYKEVNDQLNTLLKDYPNIDYEQIQNTQAGKLAINILLSQKSEGLMKLCTIDYFDEDLVNYMYKNLYLNKLNIGESKYMLSDIADDFGIKIFIPAGVNESQLDKIADVYNTLEDLSERFGKEYIPVSVINMLATNSAQGNILGRCIGGQRIDIDMYRGNVTSTLRHETMHSVDKYAHRKRMSQSEYRQDLQKRKCYQPFLEDYIERNYMPDDIVKLTNDIIKCEVKNIAGKKIKVFDADKCKYKEEFLKAGVSPYHVPYAYTNRAEFIAVAAEGDMSMYSDEFKEVLKKLGMPDEAFKSVDGESIGMNIYENIFSYTMNPNEAYDKMMLMFQRYQPEV